MRSTVRRAKRALDIVGSLVGLVVLAPLLPLVAAAIKLDSRGPVLFRQQRVGIDRRLEAGDTSGGRRRKDLGGAIFSMVKFRTMCEDAEQISGPSWTTDRDPRITRVGRILRRTKIDELPQLWNVLRGHMSLVGPRPETPHFVDKLARELPTYRERVAGVKPGITGLAQLQCEDDGSFFGSLREKVYYDLLYGTALIHTEHWHGILALDVGIILRTCRRLLASRKSFDRDVIRIEIPRRFEHLALEPRELVRFTPYGVRSEILDNPDKITMWWYLPRARKQSPPEHDYLGVRVLRELSDHVTYVRDRDGRGVNTLRLVKALQPDADPPDQGAEELAAIPFRAQFTDTIKIEAPSKVHIIARVEEFLSHVWEELAKRSPDDHFAMNMSLLLLEALTNVIKHAHPRDPEERIPIEILIENDRVTIKVMDYGEGFDLARTGGSDRSGWLRAAERASERPDARGAEAAPPVPAECPEDRDAEPDSTGGDPESAGNEAERRSRA